MKLTRQMYNYLQKKIIDPNVRNDIEKIYYERSHNCLNLLADLVIERHKYAKSLGLNTYFNLTQKKIHSSSDGIKLLINDLIVKINDRSRKEIERIHRELKNDGYTKKVSHTDIVYYYEKLKAKNLFKPSHVLQTMIDIVNKYFNVSFKKINYPNLWSPEIISFELIYNKQSIGVIHFDIIKRKNKNVTHPIALHLCHNYVDYDAVVHNTRIIILANYLSYENECISYTDIVLLFREFGYALQQMFYKSPNGVIFINEEFNTLLSQIMEYIAWEKTTIKQICNTDDNSFVEHILFTRYISFATIIKNRCINALFDHCIHNSPDLMDMLESAYDDRGETLLLLYKKIYYDTILIQSQSDLFELDINGINPTVIYQEINGSEGFVYGNILTEMLSYNIFTIIKSGYGEQFIKNVLEMDPFKMKKALHKFMTSFEKDSYDIYLQDVIGYNELDTDINKQLLITDVTNKFDDDNE